MNEDNFYDRKDDIKKLLKASGIDAAGPEGLTLRALFNELNAMRVPFFFAAAVSNSEEGTEYVCETRTPGSMELNLTDDKFADFLNIKNHGFVTIPSTELTSESIQALKKLQETKGNGSFYSEDAMMEFAKGQKIEIMDDNMLDDDDDDSMGGDFPHGGSRSVVESVMRHTIADDIVREESGPEQIPLPVCHCKPLNINWGVDSSHAYGEGFTKLDERHKRILKGDGSFLLAKEQEAALISSRQSEGGNAVEEKGIGETGTEEEDAKETGSDGQG